MNVTCVTVTFRHVINHLDHHQSLQLPLKPQHSILKPQLACLVPHHPPGKTMRMKMGPNDASGIVWAISKFSFFLSCFIINN